MAADETLYPYRGHIGIKQSNRSKTAKYGLLYCSLCNSVVLYTNFTHPYAGKPSQINEESSKYYVKGSGEYTKYLVNGASEYTSFPGCKISLDQYSTSVSPAAWAIEKEFTLVGTLLLDRKSIPKETKSLEHRKEKATMYTYAKDQNVIFVSYIDKKGMVRKMLVLTTMYDNVRVAKE